MDFTTVAGVLAVGCAIGAVGYAVGRRRGNNRTIAEEIRARSTDMEAVRARIDAVVGELREHRFTEKLERLVEFNTRHPFAVEPFDEQRVDEVLASLGRLGHAEGAAPARHRADERRTNLYVLLSQIAAHGERDRALQVVASLCREVVDDSNVAAYLVEIAQERPWTWLYSTAVLDQLIASHDEKFVRAANQQGAELLERFNRLANDYAGNFADVVANELRDVFDVEMTFLRRSGRPARRFHWIASNVELVSSMWTAADVDVVMEAVHGGVPQTAAAVSRLGLARAGDAEQVALVDHIIDELGRAATDHTRAADALLALFTALETFESADSASAELADAHRARAHRALVEAGRKQRAVRDMLVAGGVPTEVR